MGLPYPGSLLDRLHSYILQNWAQSSYWTLFWQLA